VIFLKTNWRRGHIKRDPQPQPNKYSTDIDAQVNRIGGFTSINANKLFLLFEFAYSCDHPIHAVSSFVGLQLHSLLYYSSLFLWLINNTNIISYSLLLTKKHCTNLHHQLTSDERNSCVYDTIYKVQYLAERTSMAIVLHDNLYTKEIT